MGAAVDDGEGGRQMMFGDPTEFAVEAMVEPGPQFGPVLGRNVLGRVCVWIGGSAIGRIEEPACVLGPTCGHLTGLRDGMEDLWDPAFDGLSGEEIFDRLDYLYYGCLRDRRVSGAWTDSPWSGVTEEPKDAERYVFLTNVSEAFDGWKAFLVRPTRDTLQALVSHDDRDVIVATTVSVAAFVSAVTAFGEWLVEQERLLLPRGSR